MDPEENPINNLGDEENILEDKTSLSNALHNKGKLSALRTYQGDVALFIKSKDQSVADIAIKNREEKEKREKAEEAGTRKNFFVPIVPAETLRKEDPVKGESKFGNFFLYSLGALVLLFAIAALGYFVFLNLKDEPGEIIRDSSSLIRAGNTIVMEVSNLNQETFNTTVTSAKNGSDYNKAITSIEISDAVEKEVISSSDFINKVEWSMPGALTRSLAPEFMLGLHPAGATPEFFAIFKVNDYGIAFRDMLEWEKTLPTDLEAVLVMNSASTTNYAINFSWKDLIVKNKDTRSFVSPTGKLSIIYTFIDQNTILITESEDTLSLLVNSFVSGGVVR